ncbi:MAG: hypothetical protein JWO31_849, partial [Phycisphaerales bacterium]|nr:hypothetical protein [Phycisphaerales bacterium]
VKQMEPHVLEPTPSDGLAKFAIELNRGTVARLGLKAGDVVDLPPRVTAPPDLE